jgi:hypothetical protein
MPGRYIVTNNDQVLDISTQLNERERRFAQRADGELDPHYALEAAIDMLSKPGIPPAPVESRSRSLLAWLVPKRLTPLGGSS